MLENLIFTEFYEVFTFQHDTLLKPYKLYIVYVSSPNKPKKNLRLERVNNIHKTRLKYRCNISNTAEWQIYFPTCRVILFLMRTIA